MRVYKSLAELQLTYKPRKVKVQKPKPRDKYEGLQECFTNVKSCNMAGKLAYCRR